MEDLEKLNIWVRGRSIICRNIGVEYHLIQDTYSFLQVREIVLSLAIKYENLTKHNSSSKKDCFKKNCEYHNVNNKCDGNKECPFIIFGSPS